MIIDSHIHLYPRSVFENPRAWASARNEPHWLSCVAPEEGKSVQGWADVEQLITDMDEAAIDKAVMLGWYWENQASCDEQNEWYRNWMHEYPERLLGFAIVNPLAGDAALDAVKRAKEDGFVGLGEFLPQVQGFDLKHPDWLKVVELATELSMPINIHVTEPVGHHYAGKVKTPLEDYQWLVERFPETTFVLAHWGGLLPFYEMNATIRKAFKNVYYDTAASPLIYDSRIYEAVIRTIGPERILFGTDYPLLVTPRKTRTPSFLPILNALKEADISEEAQEAIFSKNMSRLLRL